MQQIGHALERRAGREIDNPPAALATHLGDHRLAAEKRPDDVDVENLAPFFRRLHLERLRREAGIDAGIVDQHVDGAERLDAARRHMRGFFLGRDIAGDTERGAAAVRHFRRRRVGAGVIGDDDIGALGGQSLGQGAADSHRAAGDNRGFSGKFHTRPQIGLHLSIFNLP